MRTKNDFLIKKLKKIKIKRQQNIILNILCHFSTGAVFGKRVNKMQVIFLQLAAVFLLH